jgi:hypothetical protein
MAEQVNEAVSARPCRQARSANKWWWLAALVLALFIGSIGCSPIAGLGLLTNSLYPNSVEPDCPLTLADKESKVVFIVAHEDEVSIDFNMREADQVICRDVVKLLTQRYKENKDKVKIVPVTTVYAYLREHRNWIAQSKQELGKHFDADYLVYIELGPMTLKQPGSSGTLYRGHVDYRIQVIDVHPTDGEAVKFERVGTSTTPEQATTEITPLNYRTLFLDRVSKDLAKRFAAHPPQDKMSDD